jgi:UDP-2,3-diacylglucosamine pyrophosphatase LpxH
MAQLSFKKIEIEQDFYSSNLNLLNFCKANFEHYGYVSAYRFQKQMQKYGITLRSRTEYHLSHKPEAKTETFDFSEVDDFGIEPAIGKDYVSARLPEAIKRIGILSDIHVPFHSMEALICAIKYLKSKSIECLYLNGDVFDFYSISRHEKERDLRDLPREIEMCRNFLVKIREIFPKIPIYFKMGNHENRWQRYLNDQAEEFAQLHEMQFEQFFRLDKLKIDFVPDWQGFEMGDLLVVHGHEIMAGGMNPSQTTFNKTFCNTLLGHVHRTTATTKKTGFKEYIHTFSTGCLTYLSPKYYPYAQHNHGFAFVEIKDGAAKVENLMIKDGKIV